MKIFLDESGNTGTNNFDEEQPLYCTGGLILVEENLEKDVEDV